MNNRGKLLVMLLVAAGLTAAMAAIWHQRRETRHALRFWGPETAGLIRQAPSVELRAMVAEGPTGSIPRSAEANEIGAARGLIHFRRSLLEDANYEWTDTPEMAGSGTCQYQITFSDGSEKAVLRFDLKNRLIVAAEGVNRAARITERMAAGIAIFLEDARHQQK